MSVCKYIHNIRVSILTILCGHSQMILLPKYHFLNFLSVLTKQKGKKKGKKKRNTTKKSCLLN